MLQISSRFCNNILLQLQDARQEIGRLIFWTLLKKLNYKDIYKIRIKYTKNNCQLTSALGISCFIIILYFFKEELNL